MCVLAQDIPARRRMGVRAPRILIAFDWFWNYVAPQAAALAAAGADVAVLCRTHAHEFDGDTSERQRYVDNARSHGIEVFEVPGRFRAVAALSPVIRLGRSISSWRPDVVHAHDNCDPRLLFLVHRYPLVLTIHDPTPHLGATASTGLRGRIRRIWIGSADRLVVHGEELRRRLGALEPGAEISVLPHGADVRQDPFAVPSEPLVLLFGRRERYKGLAVLLEAMQRVWRERPDVRLLIAGRGTDARDVPVDRRIEVREEYVPEAELDGLFARATLVVLPYLEASQSGVALQALGRGIPVVSSDVGAIREVLPSCEFLAPAGDCYAFAARMLQWLDHGTTTRANVLEHARRRLGWNLVAAESLALYEDIIGTVR
jgi:glycosyltransferase involved in cell wall biosynthesis